MVLKVNCLFGEQKMGEIVGSERIDRMLDDIYLVIPLFHRTVLKLDGLTHSSANSEFKVLMILMRHDTVPTSRIGAWLGVSKPNMTAVIDNLITDGFVERKPNLKDRRVIDISITEKGKKYMFECWNEVRESVKKKLSSLSEQEIDSLYTSLENIRVILMKLNEIGKENSIQSMGAPWET